MTLHTYLPQDRLRALARGESLPDRTIGSALFADISGFTPLTEVLRESLGPRRGAEELTRYLDTVYTALITEIERFDGSVIGFAGDAVTCWFDESHGQSAARATACALALQATMHAFTAISLPDHKTTALNLKVAVTSGAARRFVVGDPAINYLDAVAGATVARTSTAEHLAQKGDVLVDEATVHSLGAALTIRDWRDDHDRGERFAVIGQFTQSVPPTTQILLPTLNAEQLQTWLHQAVYAREVSGQGSFLTEFRPCVALFVRFTGIDYDADRAQAQLDAMVRSVQSIAARYEGTLMDLTIGDKGSYAYVNFGALSTHEDDARRAVKTALELKKAADALGFLAPLQCGITKGTMRVGGFGGANRRVYGALGDEVNLAARLMMTAVPDEILLSGHVHQATANDFVFEPRPPLPMKGKVEPLPVFAITGERQQRALRLPEPTYALPMVGRQAELMIINDKLDLTLQGHSQVIGISAEAGMGKSRLVAEVIRLAHKMGFVGYGGACQSDAINTPYQTWKSVWQAFFDIDPSAPLRKQIRSLEGELEDRAPERLEARPLLGILLDLEISDNDFTKTLEPKYRQSALHALLEDCLRTAAKEEPLLIIIEDLHWIDALSHDLLEELARALIDSPVCFVLAYRPPELARLVAPRLDALPNFTKIELRELNVTEAEQAIRAKLAQLYPERGGAVPRVLVQKLMARAQGNPFYLEELLNFLHDRGFDPREPNAWEKIELPDSLYTLILSRIDQLSAHEQTTLRAASIVGRLFRAAWVTGYYPELGGLSMVRRDLDQLAEMDITPLDASEPELTYLFKHIVTHEVTYESLPFTTRARLHEQLAAYLEEQIAAGTMRESPLLDTLVFHYTHSENHVKQREYLRKAGQTALNICAYSTAVGYLARLVELTPAEDPALAALTLQLADAYRHLGDFPATRAALQQAHVAATTDAEHAAVLASLGLTMSFLGDYAEAQSIFARAVLLARASGPPETLCDALVGLGDVHWLLGKLDDARVVLDESLALARTLGDVHYEWKVLIQLGLLTGTQGNLAEAERLWQEVYVQAMAAGNRGVAIVTLNNLGGAASTRLDYATARSDFEQALVLAREISMRPAIAMLLNNLADTDIQLGQLAAARARLHEGLALALRLSTLRWVVGAVTTFAKLAHVEGQTERALALIGLVRRQPAWGCDEQRDLDETFAKWALDPKVVEAGLAEGATLNWDATIQELLKE